MNEANYGKCIDRSVIWEFSKCTINEQQQGVCMKKDSIQILANFMEEIEGRELEDEVM